MSKFVDTSLDKKVEAMSFKEKQNMIAPIINPIEDLEQQEEERRKSANIMVLEPERKLTNDFVESKMQMTERYAEQKLTKGKLMLEDATTRRMTQLEKNLKGVYAKLDQTHDYLRKLETQNAEMKDAIVACKLGALQLDITTMQIVKREKKMKKTLELEQELVVLQSEVSKKKEKTSKLEKVLDQIKQRRQEAETQSKNEIKAKNEARTLVSREQLLKEAAEARIRKIEEVDMKMCIDFQEHIDCVNGIEQEISTLRQLLELRSSNKN